MYGQNPSSIYNNGVVVYFLYGGLNRVFIGGKSDRTVDIDSICSYRAMVYLGLCYLFRVE